MMLHELKKRIRPILASTLAFAVVGYFLYHVAQGDRGLFAMLKLLRRLDVAQETLANLEKERSVWANRIQLIKPKTLNKDMLDEQARSQLGLAEPDEVVIMDTTVTPPAETPGGPAH